MPRILAVVVLYFPARPAEEIIKGFKDDVDDVLIVDNTNNNIGVAAALNHGLRKAAAENYEWLLTMDQDSEFEHGSLSKLKKIAQESADDVGWIAPFHKTQRRDEGTRRRGSNGTRGRRDEGTRGRGKDGTRGRRDEGTRGRGKDGTRGRRDEGRRGRGDEIEEVRFEMTSGSLVRVNTIGYFEEKLFIDSVDNEYCLRLRKNGYKVIRANDAVLNHQLGTLKKSWLGFSTIVHPASRRYYITRNMLWLMKEHPEFFFFGLKEIIKSLSLIILIEGDKVAKLHAMMKGIRNAKSLSY